MSEQKHVVLVDDDPGIRNDLSRALADQGYRVSAVESGENLDKLLRHANPDLLLLDVMLPGEDGLSICRRVRDVSAMPIMMLTARDDEIDRVLGLELGADDYLSKPFSTRELIARIKAVLRRSTLGPSTQQQRLRQVRFDRWTFDLQHRNLLDDQGVLIKLSSSEHELLALFVQYPMETLTRDQLYELTRGKLIGPEARSVDVQISRLRKKLELDPANPQLIQTVRAAGYRLAAEIEIL